MSSAAVLYYCTIFGLLLVQSTALDTRYYTQAQDEAGASGPASDSVSVSSKGMIALCTIVGIVVVIGLSSTALFFIAKKRQWAMREAIYRSARQVTQAIKTPLTPRFPKVPEAPRKSQTRRDKKEMTSDEVSDLEKGFKTSNSNDCSITVTPRESDHKSEGRTKGRGSFLSFGRS